MKNIIIETLPTILKIFLIFSLFKIIEFLANKIKLEDYKWTGNSLENLEHIDICWFSYKEKKNNNNKKPISSPSYRFKVNGVLFIIFRNNMSILHRIRLIGWLLKEHFNKKTEKILPDFFVYAYIIPLHTIYLYNKNNE